MRAKGWLALAAALVVPGAGHVLLGRPARGLLFLSWMILFGVISWHMTEGRAVSFIGRLAGGVAIWALSVVEVARLASRDRRS